MITGTVTFMCQIDVDCADEAELNKEIADTKALLLEVKGVTDCEVEDQDVEDDGVDS